MKYSAVIVAAGKGQRTGLAYNKVFYQLNSGKTVLQSAINNFKDDQNCREVIIVVNPEEYEYCLKQYPDPVLVWVKGGEKRSDSVYNGLLEVKQEKVLIHDGARPFLPPDCLQRITEALINYQAVIPVVPVKDTIKIVTNNQVNSTPNRELLFQVQTPQAFDTKLIINCYKKAQAKGFVSSDDAGLVEEFSNTVVYTVAGDYRNIKITTKEDLEN